jgi:hypothetical protein
MSLEATIAAYAQDNVERCTRMQIFVQFALDESKKLKELHETVLTQVQTDKSANAYVTKNLSKINEVRGVLLARLSELQYLTQEHQNFIRDRAAALARPSPMVPTGHGCDRGQAAALARPYPMVPTGHGCDRGQAAALARPYPMVPTGHGYERDPAAALALCHPVYGCDRGRAATEARGGARDHPTVTTVHGGTRAGQRTVHGDDYIHELVRLLHEL